MIELDIFNTATKLKPTQIRRDGGTQPRAGIDNATVVEYADAMRSGDQFPPIDVFFDGQAYWLANGFHRYEAHLQAHGSFTPITVTIHQGTQRDAVLFSVGANADHGLRRKPEDLRRSVLLLLRDNEWGQWNNSEIARRAKCSEAYVRKIKKEEGIDTSHSAKYTHPKTGEVTTMNTANIGASSKPTTASVDDLTRHVGSWLTSRYGEPPKLLLSFAANRTSAYRSDLEKFIKIRGITFTAADLEAAIAEVITNVVNTGTTEAAAAPTPATVTNKDFDIPAPATTAALPPLGLVERATTNAGKTLVQAFDNADYQVDERAAAADAAAAQYEASIAFTAADRQAIKRATATSLPGGTYNVVLADPPWQYNNTGLNGAAANHYPTMSMSELSRLLDDIQLNIAANAVLFMWATNPMLADALDLINDWRFTYKTNIVWVKDRIGTGFYVRGMHELLLIATRGAFTPLETNHTPPLTSVITASTQEHSRKPDEAYRLIEALYPGCSYIELFARRRRDGWDAWGNEVTQ